MNAKAISEKKKGGGCVLVGVGLIFLAAGLFFLWMVFLSPLYQSLGSGQWPQVPCKILKSEVKIVSDSDGNSYKPIVEYQYVVEGVEYSGDSPTFEDIAARKSWAKGIVGKYEVGSVTVCYFDPDRPETSVLDRTFLWSFYAMALLPMLFVTMGALMLGSGIFGWSFGSGKPKKTISGDLRAKSSRNSGQAASSFTNSSARPNTDVAGLHEGDLADQEWSVPKRLVRTQSRWIGLIVIGICAAFWNGFVGFFVVAGINDGNDLFSTLFMIPFVLVGLLLLVGVVYALLAVFNPEVEVALSTGAVAPGESVDVAWEVKGKASKFKTLKIEVHAVQTATYRRGTDTYTENEKFQLIPILETSQPDEMEFGSAVVTIPTPTMHTFAASNNKIKWEVVVHGDIPWWPDVKESFEFRVKPTA